LNIELGFIIKEFDWVYVVIVINWYWLIALNRAVNLQLPKGIRGRCAFDAQ